MKLSYSMNMESWACELVDGYGSCDNATNVIILYIVNQDYVHIAINKGDSI